MPIIMAILVLMLVISYYIFRQDMFSCTFIFVAGYFISALFASLNVETWGTEISGKLIIVLATGWIAFMLGELFLKEVRYRGKWQNYEVTELIKIKVQPFVLFCDVIIDLFITLLLFREVSSIAGAGGTQGIIAAYKQSSTEYSLSGMITQLLKITTASAFIFGGIFCNNLCCTKVSTKKVIKEFPLLIPGVIYCSQCIMKGGRYNVIAYIIALVFYFYFLKQYKEKWKYKIRIKTLIKLILGAVAIVYLFWLIKGFVGRSNEATLFDYISQYIGGPYDLFNQFIAYGSSNHGSETFAGLVTSINKLLGTDLSSVGYHEFRFTSTGIMLGNAYTGIRNYYSDFGIFGVFVMCFVLSLIFNSIYCGLSKSGNIYKKFFGLIFYGSVFYCIVFHFFTDYFFARLSVGYFIELIVMFILYWLIMRVRFTFGHIGRRHL